MNEEKGAVKLNVCRCCGHQYPLIKRRYTGQCKAVYAVQCQRCQTRTAWAKRKYKAIETWNRGNE